MQIGISRSQIYKAITFLKRVNLLFPLIERTGRGNHSLYKLNWLKPAKKCPTLSIKDIKTLSLRKDMTVQTIKVFKGEQGKVIGAFRKLLEKTFLTASEVKYCVGVVGRYLKGKSIEFSRCVYSSLAVRASRFRLEPPNWVLHVRDLCRWMWGVLKTC